MGDGNHSMWEHLPLLVRANSKDSVEYILQALWRTRRTGLDAADRQIFRDILQLSEDSDLDPLLVCLRVLIRSCVFENVNKDDIQKLFPAEVLPELQRLLTILLLKFQKEWREDISKDPETVPRLKAMTWNMANQNVQHLEPVAIINLRLQSDAQPNLGDKNVKFQLAKDSMEMMLKSMYCIKDQLSDPPYRYFPVIAEPGRSLKFKEECFYFTTFNSSRRIVIF
ncbi:COMM domain-containing protein [Dorcoceras hygrometricum]|uniref:COMM domain-containing protein n=1 Tax=Dorcoceras hygrometricum TaxID=472368 RepID=A0A2Z7CIH1_9LAMI|nr:COMM domain-containing protein [Dorcoceras hygrometricum]